MIKILMSGCNGKMGQVITRLASRSDKVKIVAGFDINTSVKNSYPVYKTTGEINEEVDVVIDFSNPAAFDEVISFVLRKKAALVMATTGLTETQVNKLKAVSEEVPVFFSANMSLGINLIIDLVKKAAKVLEDNFDIEIIEKHHNQKIDAPSGTALILADAINSVLKTKHEYVYDRHSERKMRGKNEIGIHAVRGGTIAGEHSVIFAGNDEIIEINHMALSKDVFGIGAIRAAEFIYGKKPGLYSMSDLVGSGDEKV